MIFKISKQELNALYRKAEESYYKCINNKDNKFLEEEFPVPIASVKLKYSYVNVVFFEDEINRYNLDIKLALWSDSKIGEYWFVEDDKGNVVDDGLVIY